MLRIIYLLHKKMQKSIAHQGVFNPFSCTVMKAHVPRQFKNWTPGLSSSSKVRVQTGMLEAGHPVSDLLRRTAALVKSFRRNLSGMPASSVRQGW